MISSINPFTGKVIYEHREHTAGEVESIIAKTHHAYQQWKNTGMEQRGKFFKHLATLLRSNKETYARLITEEMGKIIVESRGEVEKCAWLCDYYAEHAASMLEPEFYESDAGKSYVRFDPVGIIYGIMPWNFPFWQVFRAAVPTMMAGNAFILKHAPNVLQTAKAIEKLFREAGFPENIFSLVIIPVELSEKIVAHPLVEGVTLTGSQRAGTIVEALIPTLF